MRTVVFVGGDIGRSPRMQFHALSLAQCAGHAVDLVGLKGDPALTMMLPSFRVCVCACVYSYVHVYVCVPVCLCLCVPVCIHMYMCMSVCLCACVCACVHLYVCACVCVCLSKT